MDQPTRLATPGAFACTLDIFDAAAGSDGKRPAVRHLSDVSDAGRDTVLDYAELRRRIVQVANLFHRLGIRRQDAVAILLPLGPEAMLALWGAEAAGIAMPLNPFLSVDHMAHLLKAVDGRVLVVAGPQIDPELWDKAQALRRLVPTLTSLIQVGGPAQPGALDFAAAALEESGSALSGSRPGADDVAACFHTGGTTGAPKLARHLHRNQVHAACAAARAFDYRAGERVFCGMPLFHVAGSLLLALAGAVARAEVVVLTPAGLRNRDVVQNFWRLVERYRPGITAGSPTSLVALDGVPVAGADISSVRMWFVGGAPLPPEVARRFESSTGIPVREGYGMTESGGLIAVTPVSEPRVPGSAGRAIDGLELRVVAAGSDPDEAHPVEVGVSGMVVARGANVFPGYVDARMDSGVLTPGGWLVTGDLGRLDSAGRLFLTGRAKDVIIRGSHNVDPAAIEEVAAMHPGVLHCAAVGQLDAYAGEVPVLYVSLQPGMAVDLDELGRFVAERVAEPPARPRAVYRLDELPMTAVGKIFKPTLRLDAARRATVLALSPMGERWGQIGVDMSLDPERGMLATVTIAASGATARFAADAGPLLAGFSAKFGFREATHGDDA